MTIKIKTNMDTGVFFFFTKGKMKIIQTVLNLHNASDKDERVFPQQTCLPDPFHFYSFGKSE